jgi:hypothetical protein
MFALPRGESTVLFFSCCGSVVALPALANSNEHKAKKIYRDRTRPHTARFARRPQLERLEW